MNKLKAAIKNDIWLVVLDAVLIYFSYYVALAGRIRLAGGVAADWHEPLSHLQIFTFAYIILCIAVFAAFRLYSGIWKYAGVNDFLRLLAANAVCFVIQFLGTTILLRNMPFVYYAVGAALQLLLTTLTRFFYRILQLLRKKKSPAGKTALVIGSGDLGRQTITALQNGDSYHVVCVIDLSDDLVGKYIDGIPVNSIYQLEEAISKYDVSCVFLAEPLLDPVSKDKIQKTCNEKTIELRDFNNIGEKVESGTQKHSFDYVPVTEVDEVWAKEYKRQYGQDVSFF